MSDKIAPEKTNTPPEKLENGERLPLVWERILCLIIAALLGLLFAKNGSGLLRDMGWANKSLVESIQLEILFLSLPVLYALWLFRTWDTQKSIDTARQSVEAAKQSEKTTRESVEIAKQSQKTARENVETAQKNLESNTFARNINMLASDDLRSRCLGLIQLAEIKRQGHFVKEIDNATRQNIKLNGASFLKENLSGLNLERAELVDTVFPEGTDLSGANLQNTNMHNVTLCGVVLKGANLQGACLTEANFKDADLENADLRGADLSTAKNLEHANLMGAKYNDGTKFPKAFGRFRWDQENKAKSMGMKYVRDTVTRP